MVAVPPVLKVTVTSPPASFTGSSKLSLTVICSPAFKGLASLGGVSV